MQTKEEKKKYKHERYLKYKEEYRIHNYKYRLNPKNKIKAKQYGKKWNKLNKEKQNDYHNNRYATNVQYKLAKLLRSRLYKALNTQYALQSKYKKKQSALKLVGCTIKDLKQYLQLKFKKGMTWDNYGEWHIDHIQPCYKFNLTKLKEQKACFHYTNLQPLWAEDNLNKGRQWN